MIQSLRGAAGTWIVKALFVLLILSFGAWGIGDYVTGGSDPVVAEAGDVEITTSQLREAYDGTIARMRANFGLELDADQARVMGIGQQALDQLVNDAARRSVIGQMGLTASDALVAQTIRSEPAFRGVDGNFSRFAYESALARAGFSEAQYAALLRAGVAETAVNSAVSAAVSTPAPILDLMAERRGARRGLEGLRVPLAAAPPPAPVDEAAIAERYEAEQGAFMRPERRRVAYVDLSVAEIADSIEIDETRLRAEFEERRDSFTEPARLELRQMVFDAAEAAQAVASAARAAGALKAGEDRPAIVDLGFVERQDVLPELAEAAFAAESGAIVGPVETNLGFHVAEIGAYDRAVIPEFDDLRDEVRATLAEEEALDRAAEIATAIDNALGGGLPLEEAAREAGVSVLTSPAFDRGGATDDEIDFDPPGGEAFLATAFETPAAESSLLIDTDDGGFFVLRVDDVLSPEPLPLEIAAPEIRAMLEAERAQDTAIAFARSLADRVRRGETLDALATEIDGAERLDIDAMDRRGALDGGGRAPLAPDSVAEIFDAAPGDILALPAGGGAIVGRVRSAGATAPDREQLAREFDRGLGPVLDAALTNAMRDAANVEINGEAVQRALGDRL